MPEVGLDPVLLEILVCPDDKGPLWYLEEDGLLYNPRLRRAYPVRDGIPVLLVGEAREVGEEEHERLSAAHAAAPRTTGSPAPGR